MSHYSLRCAFKSYKNTAWKLKSVCAAFALTAVSVSVELLFNLFGILNVHQSS